MREVVDRYYLGGKKLSDYLEKVSLKESKVLKDLRKYTNTRKDAMMISSPITQQLSKILLKTVNAKKTLDIGVFTGYSSLFVASNLPKEGKVYALEFDDKNMDIAKQWWKKGGVEEKIVPMKGAANDSLQKLIDEKNEGTFDYAFIDADKVNYLNYYEKCLVLLKRGGLIVFDNTLWKGTVYKRGGPSTYILLPILARLLPFVKKFKMFNDGMKTIRRLNMFLVNDERTDVVLLPLDDGVTVVRKN